MRILNILINFIRRRMISIIIPCYNRAHTINKCIDSILNQTYKNFEIILVNDGSTDFLKEKIDKYIKLNNFKYLKQENKGAQAARNSGIKESKYEWICFLDSDDEWFKNKLEVQIKILKEHNFDKNIVSYSNCLIFTENNNKTKEYKINEFNGTNCFNDLLLKQGPMFQSLFVSKYLLNKINYLDEEVISWQEWDTAIRLSKFANFIHIEEPLFIYNLHEGPTISKDYVNYIKVIYIYYINLKTI